MKILKILFFVLIGAVIGAIIGGIIAGLHPQPVVDDVDNLGNLVIWLMGIAIGASGGAIAGLITGIIVFLRKKHISTNHK